MSKRSRWCVAVVTAVLCGCNRSAVPDAGARPEVLLTANDLASLGVKVDASQGNAHVERPQGRVEVNYEYRHEGVALANSLNLETTPAAAQRFYDDMLAGQQEILARDNLKMGSCPPNADRDKILAWGELGACFEVNNDKGPAGFFLQAKKGLRIYLLMVFSPDIEALQPKVLALAAARLDALAAYQP
jgi:hypothetical protein